MKIDLLKTLLETISSKGGSFQRVASPAEYKKMFGIDVSLSPEEQEEMRRLYERGEMFLSPKSLYGQESLNENT